ncbi:MAG TPA: hypothetical protein VGO55_15560 [Allosphingosinicella sp.]|jgi:hypothetical protein|nr:hypothetical protein [Allosphingosinicella sp.]
MTNRERRIKIDGGPSVLFDAVVILASDTGAALLAGDAVSKDFLSDAFNHCKFIGYSAAVLALFEKAGLATDIDKGVHRNRVGTRCRRISSRVRGPAPLGSGAEGGSRCQGDPLIAAADPASRPIEPDEIGPAAGRIGPK